MHQSSPSRIPLVLRLKYAWLALGALAAASLACNMPGLSAGDSIEAESEYPLADAIFEETGVSLEDALAVTPEDRRQEILSQLGPPDAFSLEWQELEGRRVRWEEWSYFDFRSRFDFVDGELVWTLDIDPAPDGTLYAHAFDPLAFEAGLSSDEVMDRLPDISLTELPLDEADIPGGMLVAGDQILLGFDQNELVYVQTFILTPEDPESPAIESSTSPATASPTVTSTAPTEPAPAWIHDRFDDPDGTAQPLFGSEHMTFELDQGVGRMTAHNPGVLVATYPAPQVDDFDASLRFRLPNPRSGAGAGIVFRSDDADGGLAHYYLLLVYPADNFVVLKRFQDQRLVEVQRSPLASGSLPAGTPITLSLGCRGNEFSVYVNNMPAFKAQDAKLPLPGILGLAMIDPYEGDQVLFEEFRVEASDE